MNRKRSNLSWTALAVAAGLLLAVSALWLRGSEVVDPAEPAPPRGEPGAEPAVQAVLHDDGRAILLDFGPFQLPPGAGHHDLDQPAPSMVRAPAGGWIQGFRVDIVDAGGRVLPRGVLHHINVIATQRREVFSQIMRRIAAAGQETGPVRLPRFVGLPISEDEEILVAAMLHNPTGESYRDVYIRVRLLLAPERRLLRPLSVLPFYLDVMPPASVHAFDLPPGRFEQSWEGSPAISGRILGVGGHLHRYGVELVLEDVTRRRVLWRASPILDEDGAVIGMPTSTFLLRGGIRLRSDHVYRLRAVYDNPTGRTIPLGGMGALGGMFLPSLGERLPSADPTDPEYQLDMELLHQPYQHGHAPGPHAHGHQHERGPAHQTGPQHEHAHQTATQPAHEHD